MWLIGFVTFFLSAILDNLTTTIVMVSLMQKLLANRERPPVLRRDHRDRRQCRRRLVADRRRDHDDAVDRRSDHAACDHQGQCSCPRSSTWSCRCSSSASRSGARRSLRPDGERTICATPSVFERNLMFFLGLGILIAGAGLQDRHPPAALHGHPVRPRHPLARSASWSTAQGMRTSRSRLTLVHALTRIDMSSIVFFIGILLAVATLEHAHILRDARQMARRHVSAGRT